MREKTGDRILPAVYSDGYVALMPGEKRQPVLAAAIRRAVSENRSFGVTAL